MSGGEDPFAGFEGDLDYWSLPAAIAEVEVSATDGLPDDETQQRFLLYVGLFDALVERLWQVCDTDEERELRLSRILRQLDTVEPTLRFDLHDKSGRAEKLELVARMRGKEIALTAEWMIPHLERDKEIYRARIASLERALKDCST